MKKTKGFTFIELLIVIGIILLLVTMLLPMIVYAMKQARIADATSRIENLKLALDQYMHETGFYPSDQNRKRQAYHVDKESNINMVETIDGDGEQPMHQVTRNDDNQYQYLQIPKKDLDDEDAYVDPWGVYIRYRENASKYYTAKHTFVTNSMIKNYMSYDIWSAGPNLVSVLESPEDEQNEDDVGNWQN